MSLNNSSNKSKDVFLPTLKSNMANHPVFYNNTQFVSNTRAFYSDLDKRLDENNDILFNVLNKSNNKINKYLENNKII